jgi:hypothetical protein
MKKTIAFLSGLMFFACLNAQIRDDLYGEIDDSPKKDEFLKNIQKGTSKIVLHNNLTKSENFQLIGENLVENDYQIDKANKDFWIISTVPKSLEKLNVIYLLNFVAKDSSISITGTFKINVTIKMNHVESEFSFDKIENKGMQGSPVKEAFLKMYAFACILGDKEKMEFIVN